MSVRYHSQIGTINFRLQGCYGLLPTRPGYRACWVESVCIWSVDLELENVHGFICRRVGDECFELIRISSPSKQHSRAFCHVFFVQCVQKVILNAATTKFDGIHGNKSLQRRTKINFNTFSKYLFNVSCIF